MEVRANTGHAADWLEPIEWRFPKKTAPREVRSPGPRDMEVCSMPASHTNGRAGGEVHCLRALVGVNLRIARREALAASVRAHRLMELGAEGAAEAHRRLMTVLSEIDEIRSPAPVPARGGLLRQGPRVI